jgi:hypothetical protein
VFPFRRKRLLIRAAIAVFFLGNSLWSLVSHVRADEMSGLFAVLRITALCAFIYLGALTGWQLLTRRPVLTVSRTGVQLGKSSVDWHQIARIDDPPVASFSGFRSIELQPVDRHGSKAFSITQDHAPDLQKLATWLRTLHAEQTHPTNG